MDVVVVAAMALISPSFFLFASSICLEASRIPSIDPSRVIRQDGGVVSMVIHPLEGVLPWFLTLLPLPHEIASMSIRGTSTLAYSTCSCCLTLPVILLLTTLATCMFLQGFLWPEHAALVVMAVSPAFTRSYRAIILLHVIIVHPTATTACPCAVVVLLILSRKYLTEHNSHAASSLLPNSVVSQLAPFFTISCSYSTLILSSFSI